MNQPREEATLPVKASRRYFQSAPCRLYTARQICDLFSVSRRTFFDWRKAGKLPLVEVRVGRTVRYQAAPIDRVLAGRG